MPEKIQFSFNGQPITARPGQSIAAALLAAGHATLGTTSRQAAPRGLFCGMGVCFDCLVTIDDRGNQQACLVPATEGLQVTQRQGHEGEAPG